MNSGPLAQQFAQVREGLGDGCAFACGCEDPGNPQRCIHADRFAAVVANQIFVRYDNAADPMWDLKDALARLDSGATEGDA